VEYFNLFYLKVQFNAYDAELNALKPHIFVFLFNKDVVSHLFFFILDLRIIFFSLKEFFFEADAFLFLLIFFLVNLIISIISSFFVVMDFITYNIP
jgi:hypothetical protein